MNDFRQSFRNNSILIFVVVMAADVAVLPNCCASELRRPVALDWLNADELCVLNQTGGTLSLVDRQTDVVTELGLNLIGDARLPAKLTDMAVIDESHIVVLDSNAGELLVVRIAEKKSDVIGRVAVGHSPMNVVIEGHYAYVACLWSRRWSVVSIEDRLHPQLVDQIDLPFSPRHQLLVADSTFFVADAFGGQWTTIDIDKREIVRSGHFAGSHNVTGLALDHTGDNLLIPHMTLNAERPTTKFNVHWGDIMLNVIRKVDVKELLSEAAITDNLYYLGRPDIAAGDPTGILVTNTNRQVVCFAGTGEIGISDVGANSFDRVKVGCRPLGFVLSPEEDTVYVANQLDDTISVVQLDPARQTKVIELSVSEPTLTSSQLGERLFFDSTLSSDGWFSCHSCHTDGHTNGGLADTFGDGFAGDAKRVPTLLGVHETAPWSWNGAVDDLSEQIRKSVVSTMRGRKPTDEQVRGLVAYVQSFSAPPSVLRARGSLDAKRLDRGRRVFRSIGCAQCHEFGAYTSNDTYHVGFNDRSGSDKFNPPSLRAVSHRWRLLHDNRASSVRDVVKTLGHQNDGELTTEELEDLVYFVESL